MENESSDLNQISRERIKARRKAKKMSLEQVADKCGVKKTTVRKWEEGIIATIKYNHILALAETLNVSVAWIMGMNVPMENETSEHRVLRNELADKLMFLSLEDLKKLKILVETMFSG